MDGYAGLPVVKKKTRLSGGKATEFQSQLGGGNAVSVEYGDGWYGLWWLEGAGLVLVGVVMAFGNGY